MVLSMLSSLVRNIVETIFPSFTNSIKRKNTYVDYADEYSDDEDGVACYTPPKKKYRSSGSFDEEFNCNFQYSAMTSKTNSLNQRQQLTMAGSICTQQDEFRSPTWKRNSTAVVISDDEDEDEAEVVIISEVASPLVRRVHHPNGTRLNMSAKTVQHYSSAKVDSAKAAQNNTSAKAAQHYTATKAMQPPRHAKHSEDVALSAVKSSQKNRSAPIVVMESPLSTHSSRRSNASSSSTSSRCCRYKSALNESIRLDERIKYMEMLKKYKLPSRQLEVSSASSESSFPSPTNEFVFQRRKDPVTVIDLTKPSRKKIVIPVVTAYKTNSEEENTQRNMRVAVPRANTLEKQLRSNQHLSPQWLGTVVSKYSSIEREKQHQIKDEEMKKDVITRLNKAKHALELEERIQRHMRITDVIVETEEPSLPTLTDEMEARITSSLIPRPPSEILVEKFGLRITRKDLYTLAGLNWLNDEVINFYMNLLIERGKMKDFPSVYAFNTFFYPKLVRQGHSSLARWTRKIDVFENELLVIPIHLGVHWCMAVADFGAKAVRYYDSMGSPNTQCLNAILKYLQDESMDKKKRPFDTSDWDTINVADIPQQMNGSDCGMFSCMFAEYICRKAQITFTQADMPYFRRKMAHEIVTGSLL